MALDVIQHRLLSVDEYLALEEASDVKHEFVGGVIYALAGASKRHNVIVLNLASLLRSAAADGPCRVYANDVKLRVAEDLIYYPDVMVACGLDGGHPLIEDAPCVVVEVASPSTATVDQREKLTAYKRMPSLESYLLVEQDRRRVHCFWRDAAGVWWDSEVAGEAGVVTLSRPAAKLSLQDVYAGVDVSAS